MLDFWGAALRSPKAPILDEKKDEPWLVTESIPYGGDAVETLVVDIGLDIPTGVGELLQKEDMRLQRSIPHQELQSQKESQERGGNETTKVGLSFLG